jgi:hypothetical protein
MALEKYEYPATGGVTNSFLPTRNPEYEGREEEVDEGVIIDQSSGKKAYLYAEGVKIRTIRLRWRHMPVADRSSYETFRDVVGGQKIKYTDWQSVARTVTFAGFVRRFTPSSNDRWHWDDELREES